MSSSRVYNKRMVVYEVNLSIDREIEREYRSWLDDHVRRILALPGFTGARLYRRDPAAEEAGADDGRVHLTVQYALVDRAALAAYLEHHAPALRRDGLDRFSGRSDASRRVLDEERVYRA